ncbi:hypothetical protein [Burkholderia dolosa]|uniref:hypothetical protein n=1 Tax=Burkholderia dolosa TaxID=152500 RepID=UPI0027D304B6|nr:hypothetical protein [Burkholderia dolosa]
MARTNAYGALPRVDAGGSCRTYRTARFDGPAARHFLMSLDRDHRFPTALLGVSTANLRQNIVNQREMTALRRSPT